jgi:hypothetical protein
MRDETEDNQKQLRQPVPTKRFESGMSRVLTAQPLQVEVKQRQRLWQLRTDCCNEGRSIDTRDQETYAFPLVTAAEEDVTFVAQAISHKILCPN